MEFKSSKQASRTINSIDAPRGERQPATQSELRAVKGDNYKKKIPFMALVTSFVLVASIIVHFLAGTIPVQPKSDRYQVVFLADGKVYFGKLKRISAAYVQLDRPYYSKQQTVPQEVSPEQEATLLSNITLAKVANDAYGPDDSMQIKADQILFWQDLREDSKIVEAIESSQ